MSEDKTELYSEDDRVDFWKKEIEGKSPDEIVQIITTFEKKATRDPLTGLINEDEFKLEFEGFKDGAFRRDSHVFIAFLDFDDLKRINDTVSHEAGDELLKNGSKLLKSAFRASDLFARLHGDEFIAAIEFEDGNYSEQNVEGVIQRMVDNLAANGISISIGLAEYKRDDLIQDVINKAGLNMKTDKFSRKAGRDSK